MRKKTINTMDWKSEILKIKPFMFKISTPSGHGTGFLIFKNDQNICGVATAFHVISHAVEWNEPIKLMQFSTGIEKFLPYDPSARVIKFDAQKDLALIMFTNDDFNLDEALPELVDVGTIVDQGTEIGWNGFPVLAPNDLCFFSGYISCRLNGDDSYLVDGVSIHGVSGAPAFFLDKDSKKMKICGLISQYFPNQSTGQSLPGLAKIRSVTPLKQECENLKSMDEARKNAEKTNEKDLEKTN